MRDPIVFLSHNSRDKRFARKLGAALEEQGIRVWIDEAQIRVGDSLLQKIADGLQGATHLAVILSPASVSSKWVQRELEIATNREIQGKRVRVLPILYRDCDIPIFLEGKLYADFRNRRMYHRSLGRFIESLLPDGVATVILDTVRNAARAEFEAYARLPKVSISRLSRWFTKGSAHRRIVHLLRRHAKRGWVINNPGNPSTLEVLDARIKTLGVVRAVVETEEYCYLRWYERKSDTYKVIYNEKNTQTYTVLKTPVGWRVDVNAYPPPGGAKT